jgi:hypothetical protein
MLVDNIGIAAMTRSSSSARATLAATLAVAGMLVVAAACGGGGAKGSAAGLAPLQNAQAAGKGGELTTAEAVLEASIAAQGGRARLAKLRALRQVGTFALPQLGIQGTMTLVAAPPRSTLLSVELPGLGKISQGVSGDVAWEVNPITGTRVISGEERTQLLRESTFTADLVWKELYSKAELAGVVEFAGRPAYKVVLTAADGDVQTRYFAKDTLLPAGSEFVARSQLGKLPIVTELSDWRDVSGLKLSHKLVRKGGPQQTVVLQFAKIELDPALDPQTFALPPEIAALPPPASP